MALKISHRRCSKTTPNRGTERRTEFQSPSTNFASLALFGLLCRLVIQKDDLGDCPWNARGSDLLFLCVLWGRNFLGGKGKQINWETPKDLEVEGSRSYQSLGTTLFRGMKAPKTLVLLCLGAIREGRMIVTNLC